jgi:isoquinoline 1-oxidoreductase beta subunit
MANGIAAINTPGISRRSLMLGAAGLTFVTATGSWRSAQAAPGVKMSAWVTIFADGSIQIMSPASEMGQGSKTSLPLILAEEMDADWKDVRIAPAPPSDAIYGNPGFLGMMYTAGSTTVFGYFEQLRTFGAQVRQVLIDNAASHFAVRADELTTAPSAVIHAPSGRRLSYGAIAAFAKVPPSAPNITKDQLKKPEAFRLIGHDVMRYELPTKVNGTARYSIDVEVPQMLYGAMLFPPSIGARPDRVSEADARKVPDLVGIYRLPIGIGVVAKTPWAAWAARDATTVEWQKDPKNADFDSSTVHDQYAKIVRGEIQRKSTPWDVAGAGSENLSDVASRIAAEFRCDYAYHAQMEPLNAVASVAADGKSVELWCGTQSQTMAVKAAADALGIPTDNVHFHEMLLGGGFGRRGPRDQDFILPAVLLSREVKLPVKVMCTREDDIHNGRFRPMSAHRLEVGFDSSGTLVTWHHRVATDNVGLCQDPDRYFGPWHERDMISLVGTEITTYAIPNRLSEHFAIDSGIRVSSLRGIGFTANKFAIESFMDELARLKGRDPVEFRLSLLQSFPRAVKVVEAVTKMADWGRKRDGRALGIAYIDYSGSQVAGVAEVSVDAKSGRIRVHNFWVAIDPGTAVQPDNIINQVEGSVVYGLGLALTEQITIMQGQVQQSNFYDYTVMRMRDIPEIQVEVMSSGAKPTGVGEMGTPVVAPAVSNAFAELTGVRLRHTPMTPDRVLAALASESKGDLPT